MTPDALAGEFLATMAFDTARSRLSLGGTEVAFHCDKFNTRILKNLEDVMGYEAGGQLLRVTAAETSHALLQKFVSSPKLADQWRQMAVRERIDAILELYKVMAYGAIQPVEIGQAKATFASTTSYLAEGWLENRERWHLDAREGPACHDICGHLAAAMALALDVPLSRIRVSETRCRAFGESKQCEFTAEVL